MRHKFIAIIFSFVLVQGISQSAVPSSEKDPKATVLLDKLKKVYKSYSSIEVVFNFEIQLPGRAAEVQAGTVIQQGKQFRLKMTDQEMYSDGKTTWVYLKKNKEVQIFSAAEASETGFISPMELMTMYEKGAFSYAITEERNVKGKQFVDIEFKPTDKFAEYSKLRMTLDKTSNKMLSLRIFSKEGSRFALSIASLTPNKKYAPSTFVFNPKSVAGVHVEDLRMNE